MRGLTLKRWQKTSHRGAGAEGTHKAVHSEGLSRFGRIEVGQLDTHLLSLPTLASLAHLCMGK